MPVLIKDGRLACGDNWFMSGLADTQGSVGRPLIPFAQFLNQHHEWTETDTAIGIWLGENDMPEALKPYLSCLEIIALHSPKFADGRVFTKAWLLRQRFGFGGEIRVTGDFLPDQVAYYARCGVTSFACRTSEEADIALTMLRPFSVHYQADVHQAALFKHREDTL